jgi:hypothetical protein
VHSVPPNTTNNQIPKKKDSSLLVLQPKRAKTTKQATTIASDWQPGERAYAWAEKQGLSRDWVQAQIDEFVIYWSDAGERRKSWDATFINRLKWLSTHQTTHSSKDSADETIQHTGLADKDYASGATPPEQISWLRAYADA